MPVDKVAEGTEKRVVAKSFGRRARKNASLLKATSEASKDP